MTRDTLKIMIVAGEASGDLHAAKLADAIREASTDLPVEFFGAAGGRMRAAGVETIVDAEGLSIVGLPEIARALPMFADAFRRLKNAAVAKRPDVIVLVDFPDFNLKLARALGRRGFRIVYYISPQLWAWRGYRVRTIRKYVDLVISILPFEKDWYAARGVGHVEYVGSPLAREVSATLAKDDLCMKHGLDPAKPIVAFLPGSRHKEIVRILPVMLDTAVKMSTSIPDLQFVIAAASDRNGVDVNAVLEDARAKGSVLPTNLFTIQDDTFNALNASDVAAVASGTATLQTGIIGTPMAIVYKTSSFNYRLLRPLIDVPHFGLINLIAGERVAAELIQDDFTAATLANELFSLLDLEENERVRKQLQEVTDRLGHGGASSRAADLILKLVRTDPPQQNSTTTRIS